MSGAIITPHVSRVRSRNLIQSKLWGDCERLCVKPGITSTRGCSMSRTCPRGSRSRTGSARSSRGTATQSHKTSPFLLVFLKTVSLVLLCQSMHQTDRKIFWFSTRLEFAVQTYQFVQSEHCSSGHGGYFLPSYWTQPLARRLWVAFYEQNILSPGNCLKVETNSWKHIDVEIEGH